MRLLDYRFQVVFAQFLNVRAGTLRDTTHLARTSSVRDVQKKNNKPFPYSSEQLQATKQRGLVQKKTKNKRVIKTCFDPRVDTKPQRVRV